MYTYGNAQGSYPRISTKAIRHMLNLMLNILKNTKIRNCTTTIPKK